MKFCVLASGSSGNATYVEAGGVRILIDAGLSCLSLERRMASRDLAPDTLDAILITHEHTDHVKGLSRFAKKYNLPVYTNEGTASVIERQCLLAKQTVPEFTLFQTGCPFCLGNLTVTPVPISHDTAEPVAYTLNDGCGCFGYFTDLGVVTPYVAGALAQCSALVFESNHDPQLLEHSSRPYPLICRIRGASGHLSNEQACQALFEHASETLRVVVLAHLSGECNRPDLAEAMMQSTFREMNRSDLLATLAVAQQDEALPIIEA